MRFCSPLIHYQRFLNIYSNFSCGFYVLRRVPSVRPPFLFALAEPQLPLISLLLSPGPEAGCEAARGGDTDGRMDGRIRVLLAMRRRVGVHRPLCGPAMTLTLPHPAPAARDCQKNPTKPNQKPPEAGMKGWGDAPRAGDTPPPGHRDAKGWKASGCHRRAAVADVTPRR